MMSSVIEDQIIPRLLRAHPVASNGESSHSRKERWASETQIVEFSRLCLQSDPSLAESFVQNLMKRGFRTEDIFLHLITPSARHLGVQWEKDELDFTQVTEALLRMHQITHRLGYEYQSGPQTAGDDRRIMLASAPGSQHILGLSIVAEFFRKEGWQVVIEISESPSELVRALENEWFDVVGISVSISAQLEGLKALITSMRKKSRNRKLAVLLGGPIFSLQSFSAEEFNANEICTDPRIAVKLAGIIQS